MAYARLDGTVDITFSKGKGQLGEVDGVRDCATDLPKPSPSVKHSSRSYIYG